jgi:NAD-dependent DNA ligase
MKIQIPTNCPCCDYPLELVNDQLFCRNTACSAQLFKKVENFTKVLGIKGFGPKTIEKLNLSDLTELFYLDPDTVAETLGEKVATKLLDEIERAKNADLATVLASMSITLVGATASKKIASVVNSIEEITPEKCREAGLGEKVTEYLINWISTEYQEMKEFLPFSFNSTPVVTSNKTGETICITGKLTSYKKKSDATELLEAAGFTVVESVTKTLTYLVDEEDKGSSKRQKADQYGITIVTNLNDFLKDKTK